MKSLLIIASIFLAEVCFAQRVQSSCDAPDSVIKKYSPTAAYIAYRYERTTQSPYKDSVIIPEQLLEQFLRPIFAVYNVHGIPAADTVTRLPLYINDNPGSVFDNFVSAELNKFTLRIDTTVPWMKNLFYRIIPTGNRAFDSIISLYNITIDSVYLDNSNYTVLLNKFYNIGVLDSLFSLSNPDLSFGGIGYPGEGDEIKVSLNKDSSVGLTYIAGWGDCEAGCEEYRVWHFTVSPDCSVRFDSSYGYPLPYVASVNSLSNIGAILIFYPNPVFGTITIETEPQSMIEIIDLEGRILEKDFRQEGSKEIDVSSLLKGMYLVRAINKSGKVETGKFIKE